MPVPLVSSGPLAEAGHAVADGAVLRTTVTPPSTRALVPGQSGDVAFDAVDGRI